MFVKRKALFFDLDGTLAEDNQPPSDVVTTAIRNLRAQGHAMFLCTGRAPCHVYESVLQIGFDGVVAGAGTFASIGDHVIFRRLLDPQHLHRIIAHYLESGQTCILEGDQNLYTVNPRYTWQEQWPLITDADAFTPSLGAFAEQGILKLTAYGTVTEETRQLLEPTMCIIDHESCAEILPAGCCKADGMRRVLEEIGIDREDSIAFGDSRNDIDMLQYAGIGVAMGGSPEVVLAAADCVTATLAENGVAQALNKLIK